MVNDLIKRDMCISRYMTSAKVSGFSPGFHPPPAPPIKGGEPKPLATTEGKLQPIPSMGGG